MIQAFLSYNPTTKSTLFKPLVPLSSSTQSLLLQLFTNYTKPKQDHTLTINSYTYAYIFQNNTYFSLIGSDPIEMLHILNSYKSVLTSDPFSNLNIISELFTNVFNPIPIENLQAIQKAESTEEKIYENMLKSKEIENYQKIKDMKSKGTVLEKQLEKVRNLELEMRNEQLKQLEKLKSVDKAEPVKKKVNLDLKGDFVVTIKEKLNFIVDRENAVQECYVNGDLSVKIAKEEFKQSQLKIKNKKKMENIKYSPNIDKSKVNEDVLYSERGYPLNKNVALMKWKRNVKPLIDFSFWVNESDNGNLVQFEVEYENLKDVVFYFKKKVVIDGVSCFEWKVNQKSVEIACGDLKDLFPIKCDFWMENGDMGIEIEKNDEMKVVKILETEKFEIVY